MEVLEYSVFPERPVVYARFWARFGASFIDGLILLVPNLIVHFLTPNNHYARLFIQTITGWLYSALQESGPSMATLGKRALNIRVTDLAGNRVTFAQATGRHFGRYLSAIILLMGYFMMLWDDKSQTLHDKMAGTLVISTE